MDDQVVDLISKLIGNLGFPIFVAVWLLIRTDKLLKNLTRAIDALKDVVEK